MIPSELTGWGPNWQELDPPFIFLSPALQQGLEHRDLGKGKNQGTGQSFVSHCQSTNKWLVGIPSWQHWIVHDLNAVYKQLFKHDSSSLTEGAHEGKCSLLCPRV